jgi:hypothetical protein
VEVQALWLNALRIGSDSSERWAALHTRARAAFEARFRNEEAWGRSSLTYPGIEVTRARRRVEDRQNRCAHEEERMISRGHGRATVVIVALALGGVVLASAGCGIVKPTRGRRGEAVQSGFLGDYSQLKEQEGYAAQEVYINPGAQWSKYTAFHIESVSMWVSDASKKPSPEDQQMITNMLYKALHDKLAENFKLVDHPGPGIVKLRFAFTQAKGAIVPLNVITTVIPQARLLATVVGLSADTAALVGSASMEAEALDSITNERLAAAVDARAGTKGILRAFSKWADVQAICDYWAGRTRDFFVKQGVRQKA